jgi:hypothetical protein
MRGFAMQEDHLCNAPQSDVSNARLGQNN